MSTARTTLDNPVFAGRLRQYGRGTPFIHIPARPRPIQDVRVTHRDIKAPSQPRSRQERSHVLQRNIAVAPKAVKHRRKVKKPSSHKLLIVMAVLVFTAGVGVAVQGLLTNTKVINQVRQATTGHSNSVEVGGAPVKVSETKPTPAAIRSYQVDTSLPRYITIPKLKVFARIRPEKLDKKGALIAPSNVHDAGWFNGSSKPGEGGALLLDGHVAGPTMHGVFYAIKDLKAGDTVQVERGDGHKFNYRVVKSVVSSASSSDMSDALLSAVDGKAGLNMITCTGTYSYKTHQYDKRITVYAVQV